MKKPVKTTTKTKKPIQAKKPVSKSTALVPVKKSTELAIDNAGDFLSERDQLIAKYLAGGKKTKEVIAIFNVDEAYVDNLQQNPIFVKYYNDRVMSRGLSSKVVRLASEKRIAEALDEELASRLSDPENTEIAAMSLSNLVRMRHESFDKIAALTGQDDDKKQQTTVTLIMENVRKNSTLNITDPDKFNPADEFPVIEVVSEQVRKRDEK